MADLVPHKLIFKGSNYSMLAPAGLYDKIGTACGITKVADDDSSIFAGRVQISEFAASGRIFKLRLSLKGGGTRFCYCAGDKVQEALGGVVNKEVDGVKVTSATLPRRAVFS